MKSVLITFCHPDEFEDVCNMSILSKVMFESCTVIVEPNGSSLICQEDAYMLVHNLVDDSVVLERI